MRSARRYGCTPGRPSRWPRSQDYGNAWRLLAAGAILRAGLLVAPVAVPAGLAIGGLLWAWRIYAITTGLAGLTASAPIEFDTRQWRRQVRAARGRAAAPGTVPLADPGRPGCDRPGHPRHPAQVAAHPHRPGPLLQPAIR